LCSSAHNSLGFVVMIAKLRIRSPVGERQFSHKPASAMMPRSASAIAIRLLAAFRVLPFVKVVDRHKAAPAFKRFAESRLALDPFRLGVDVGKADLDVLGPVGDQAPAQHVEAALPGLGIVADDGQGVGRRDVQLGGKFGVGRSGGIEKTSLISLTSEERRTRPQPLS
jgi:hypothetical protein